MSIKADRGIFKPSGWLLVALFWSLTGAASAAEVLPTKAMTHNGVTAHRGYSGRFVENTLEAFSEAIAMGVDWIECDIFLSADGQIVVTHDANMVRVSGVEAEISEHSYEFLSALDVAVGFRGDRNLNEAQMPPQRLPLLQDILELVKKQSTTRLSIQPKDGSTEAAIALIKELKATPWVGFNDGNLEKMSTVKRLAPEIPVFWDRVDIQAVDSDIDTALDRGFESLVYNRRLITDEAIDKVHKAGLEFGVWTVNDASEMRRFINQGVDRLYTDYPDKALRYFLFQH
ncbi:MAG: glycerophosphodiester phosphodiesterase [Pseudohongiellaceae bacterium]